MQCDPHCSSYSSCVSTCPVETCDNILEQGKEQRMCKEDSCVEGCELKPCEKDSIYNNDTYSECVPLKVCKPVCMEVNGVMYYEGDIMQSDQCQTCRCSRGKEVCSGAPCTTVPSAVPTIMNQEKISCTSGWSSWINQDKLISGEPSPVKTKTKTKSGKSNVLKNGDNEPIPSFFTLANKDGAFCSEKYLTAIECRTVDSHFSPKSTGEDVECSLEKGLLCIGSCHDYEFRVLCDCGDETTTRTPITYKTQQPIYSPIPTPAKYVDVTTTRPPTKAPICEPNSHVEFPGNCEKFLHCTVTPTGNWDFVEKICGPGTIFHPIHKVCDFPVNVIAIKPECGEAPQKKTTIPPIQITKSPLIVKKPTTEPPKVTKTYGEQGQAGMLPQKNIKTSTVVPYTTGRPYCDPNSHVDYPGDCSKFLHCTITMTGDWEFVEKHCGPGTFFHPIHKVCDFPQSVIVIKPECGKPVIVITKPPTTPFTTTPFVTHKHTTPGPFVTRPPTTPGPRKPTTEKLIKPTESICPPGQVWSECAIPCGKACHYYGAYLIKSGFCNPLTPNECIEGCVNIAAAKKCPLGYLKRDENDCVEIADCTCVSPKGKMMKPGEVISIGECEKCQCYENELKCDKIDCDSEEINQVDIPIGKIRKYFYTAIQ